MVCRGELRLVQHAVVECPAGGISRVALCGNCHWLEDVDLDRALMNCEIDPFSRDRGAPEEYT
jgi:hypothetical protein